MNKAQLDKTLGTVKNYVDTGLNGKTTSISYPASSDAISYVEIATFNDADSGNIHAEAIISGSGNFGTTGHLVGIIRLSGRSERRVELVIMAPNTSGTLEIGYVRDSTNGKTTVYLKRGAYDGGGLITVLSEMGCSFKRKLTSTTTAPSGYTTGSMQYMYSTLNKPSASDLGVLASSGGTMTGNITFSDSGNTSGAFKGIKGTTATNDGWRIGGSQTASNAGYLEIATKDDNNEPIYVRQYTGDFVTLIRTATLLDASGNTSFPGSVTATGGFSGALTGNVTGNVTGSSGSCTGNAASATKLATARTLTIGSKGKTFDGSGNVSWTLDEIGAAAKSHGMHPAGKTIDGNFSTAYRTQTKGNTSNGDYITTIRTDASGVSNCPQYGTGLAWGRGDTHGYMYMNYSGAGLYVGAGNADKLNWVKSVSFTDHTHNYAGSSSAGGAANSAAKLSTARTISLTGDVTGSASFDGSANASITATVANDSHTHSTYLPLAGGTMTGNLTFTSVTSTTYPAKSNMITWGGSTDGADIYYQVDASDKGRLVLNTRDDADCIIMFANNGTSKSTIDNSGNFSGKAATATKLATARTITLTGDTTGSVSFDGSANVSFETKTRKIAFVGSDTSGTAGWYKVAEQTCSGYGDTNITFMVTSTYANYNFGILQLQIRSDNSSIACKSLGWIARKGLDKSHYIVVISGMKWTLYAYQPSAQYGRLAFEILSQSNITGKSMSWTLTFADNGTKESTAPTASVTSSDVATVNSANSLSTARTLTIGSKGKTFDGSANISWSLDEIGAAPKSHTHNYAGSGSAGGAATSSQILNSNSRMDYGWNGLNYFNISGTAGNAAKANDTPTSAWWHIIRCNHANSAGFYTDIAVPFNAQSMYYKRVTSGSVQDGGWVKVLDAKNFGDYAAAKSHGTHVSWGGNGSATTCSRSDHTHSYLPLGGGTLSGPVTVSGESKFHNGTYKDPLSGTSCAIKTTGHVAVGGNVYSTKTISRMQIPTSKPSSPTNGEIWIE